MCVDASKIDGQWRKWSLHDYFSGETKKTKSNIKENHQGKGAVIWEAHWSLHSIDQSHLNYNGQLSHFHCTLSKRLSDLEDLRRKCS